MKTEDILELKDSEFLRITGVKRQVFEHILNVYVDYLKEIKRDNRGRKTSDPVTKIIITLLYYRQYMTMKVIGIYFGVSEATISRTIQHVTNALIDSKSFDLQSIEKNGTEFIVDTTEVKINRPSKDQEKYYSGKKNNIQ